MQKSGRVSEAVIRRLPKYYRYLKEMKMNGVERISSRELSRKMGLTASQIRQDFNCFGGFGQQGYGYHVDELCDEIRKILGLDKKHNVIIVGAGNLGRALANYIGFEREGFKIKAMFDANPELIGKKIGETEILAVSTMGDFIADNNIKVGMISVPKYEAQDIADQMVERGIKSIWNFAPIDVEIPDSVAIENVHLSDSLYTLSFKMNDL
ncbi:MAG TPA: redox-sensing transcriptional repressor Rex [Clostridia bacterium]|nr:redox-sensing transcriptional repressor Rex [Clostridia bacterium]